MKTVVIGEGPLCVKAAHLLRDYDPKSIHVAQAAVTSLSDVGSPHAVFLAGDSPRSIGSLAKQLRGLASSRFLYVFALGDFAFEDQVLLSEAGVEGMFPLQHGDAFQAHIDALWRLIDARMSPDGEQAPLTGLARVAGVDAWTQARVELATAMEGFLGLTAQAVDPSPGTEMQHGCGLLMSSVRSEAEIRISIGAGGDAAATLAGHLFGEADPELAGDMLGEMANICMGTLKRRFGDSDLAFTGGLPMSIATSSVVRPEVTYEHKNVFSLTMSGEGISGSVSVLVFLGLRSLANEIVAVSSLKEGMVLAQDLCGSGGALLVAEGTRLSSNMVGRLAKVIGESASVAVQATPAELQQAA